MISTLLGLLALTAAQTPTAPLPDGSVPAQAANQTALKQDRFADRPQARIAFSREVRNFEVKRDGRDDVLYLETRRDRWFRSEINCFGIEDPRDAQGLVPLDHAFGFERASRIALVGFGHRTTECRLGGLVELTPEEAVEFRLVRKRAAAPATPTPAS
jgi:hypothetical protein